MTLIRDLINSFRRPLTDEEKALRSVQEKTKALSEKKERFVSHSVYPVYKPGQRPSTFTVYHGAHA